MPEINDWDTTAANNNSAPPHGWPESMDYEDVNDAARENMAVLARWHKDTNGSLVSGGSAGAYTVTANQALTAYYNGLSLVFEANHTNADAATLDVDTVGAAAIVRLDGAALGAGDIQAGGKYRVIYDGTNFQLLGASLSPTSDQTISGSWTFAGLVVFSDSVVVTALRGLQVNNPAAAVNLIESDASAGNGRWQQIASGEALTFRMGDDAASSFTNWLNVQRTGNTIDGVTASGPWAFQGDVTMSGQINLGGTPGETISSGAINYTSGFIIIDTEGLAPTDTLDTINGGIEGDFLLIRTASGGRVPTIEDGTGNIQLAGDFVMTSPFDMLLLVHNGSTWAEVSRSDNG